MLRVKYQEVTEIYDNTRTLTQRFVPEIITIGNRKKVLRSKSERVNNGPKIIGYQTKDSRRIMGYEFSLGLEEINKTNAQLILKQDDNEYVDSRRVLSIDEFFHKIQSLVRT